MFTLPDDHAAWRLVGAWIAARQRGDPHAILTLAVDDARRATIVDDLDALVRLAPGPLRTGAELEVEARARRMDADVIEGLQVSLRGRTEAGPVPSSLTLARLERAPDGWRLAALFTDEERSCLAEPAFLQMLAARP
ncbi:MAG: hypothetical protein IT385_31005 [Deltaproteobacteria bacterium]|nr:hypothetical protein [Deltaproteobacteria bacterium]